MPKGVYPRKPKTETETEVPELKGRRKIVREPAAAAPETTQKPVRWLNFDVAISTRAITNYLAVKACLDILTPRLTQVKRGRMVSLKQAVPQVNSLLQKYFPHLKLAVDELSLRTLVRNHLDEASGWYRLAVPQEQRDRQAMDKLWKVLSEMREGSNGETE